ARAPSGAAHGGRDRLRRSRPAPPLRRRPPHRLHAQALHPGRPQTHRAGDAQLLKRFHRRVTQPLSSKRKLIAILTPHERSLLPIEAASANATIAEPTDRPYLSLITEILP